jgi:hypothetical protein
VADRLKMTVARLRDEMPNDELVLWAGYLALEQAEQKKALKEARRG